MSFLALAAQAFRLPAAPTAVRAPTMRTAFYATMQADVVKGTVRPHSLAAVHSSWSPTASTARDRRRSGSTPRRDSGSSRSRDRTTCSFTRARFTPRASAALLRARPSSLKSKPTHVRARYASRLGAYLPPSSAPVAHLARLSHAQTNAVDVTGPDGAYVQGAPRY